MLKKFQCKSRNRFYRWLCRWIGPVIYHMPGGLMNCSLCQRCSTKELERC